MRLTKLTLENFMPYRHVQEVEFSSGPRNVVVVFGDNMRGKTSFLNAIRFAFFGHATTRHLRQISKINLINDEAKAAGVWRMSVTVNLDHDGALYELRRELKPLPHIARPADDEELKDTFTLRKDGAPVTGKQLAFEMNQLMPEGISRFFLFDGELLQEYEILVRDTDAASKIKDAIEHVLGVPALTKGAEEIRTLLTQAQARQADDLRQNRTLTAQAEQQRSLQIKVSNLRLELGALQAQIETHETEAANIQGRLDSMTAAAELTQRLFSLEQQAKNLASQLALRRERRADLLQEAWRDLLAPRIEVARKSLESERETYLGGVKTTAVTLSSIEGIRNSLAEGECVTCGQPVDAPAESARLTERLRELEIRLDAASADIEKVSAISFRVEQLNRLRGFGTAGEVLKAERAIRETLVEQTACASDAAQVREALRDFDSGEVERLRSTREQLLTLIASVTREAAAKSVEISSATRQLDQVSRMLSRNPEARSQRSSRLVSAYGALDRLFTTSVDILRDRQRKRVEDFASAAFAHLTSEPDFKRLSINENYGLTIVDDKGREVPERSAGAEQIVALSLIDGLNRAGRRGGPIVMDTPFGRLDWKHRENVLSFLPEMAEQVVLLVHEGEMDRSRDLPPLRHRVGKVYRIDRVSARESRIVLEEDEGLAAAAGTVR